MQLKHVYTHCHSVTSIDNKGLTMSFTMYTCMYMYMYMKKAVMVGPDKPVIPAQHCFKLGSCHQHVKMHMLYTVHKHLPRSHDKSFVCQQNMVTGANRPSTESSSVCLQCWSWLILSIVTPFLNDSSVEVL